MGPKVNKYLVILLGTIAWSITMIRSGLTYSFGLGFWGANGHDGIWHVALSESLSRWTLENPVFAGENLKNYHLGFDFILAMLKVTTGINVSILYFQILPVIFSTLIGLLVYKFVFEWRKSDKEALWATLFVYFSGSFGFLVTFFKEGIFSGESMFWSQQSVSTLVNPPYSLSLIFVLSGLIYLLKYIKIQSFKNYILTTLFFGFLIQIKAYSAILIIGGLLAAGVYTYIKNKNLDFIKIFLGVTLLNFILFILFRSNDTINIFVWQPFWYLETLMSYSDRLGWERFYSAMTTYRMGGIWFKGIIAYTVAFTIFMVGNMGIRIVSLSFFFKAVKDKMKIDGLFVFLTSILFEAVIIPMLFVQNGTPWNTIQFFYYFLFLTSILAGISVSQIFNKSNPLLKKILFAIIFIFMAFGSWATLQHYLPSKPQAVITPQENSALLYLRSQKDGIVLTYPFDKYKSKAAISNPPRPIYLYESTAYVSAFTGKKMFVEDEVNLNIMGYSWDTRRAEIYSFIESSDVKMSKVFLKKNNIKYLYLVKEVSPLPGELLKLGSKDLGLSKIFENPTVTIFRVE